MMGLTLLSIPQLAGTKDHPPIELPGITFTTFTVEIVGLTHIHVGQTASYLAFLEPPDIPGRYQWTKFDLNDRVRFVGSTTGQTVLVEGLSETVSANEVFLHVEFIATQGDPPTAVQQMVLQVVGPLPPVHPKKLLFVRQRIIPDTGGAVFLWQVLNQDDVQWQGEGHWWESMPPATFPFLDLHTNQPLRDENGRALVVRFPGSVNPQGEPTILQIGPVDRFGFFSDPVTYSRETLEAFRELVGNRDFKVTTRLLKTHYVSTLGYPADPAARYSVDVRIGQFVCQSAQRLPSGQLTLRNCGAGPGTNP